ncbi:MAG: hypothetical protein LAT84_09610 [Balneolia bacterium]|nr:hypothetical protein [Balneolia bacterium]
MKRTVTIEKNSYEVYRNELASPGLVTTAQIAGLSSPDFSYVGYGEKELFSNDLPPVSSEAIHFASGVKGAASLSVKTTGNQNVYLSALVQDVVHIAENSGFNTELPFVLEIKAGLCELEFGYNHENGKANSYDSTQVSGVKMFGFCLRPPEHIPREDEHVRRLSEFLLNHAAGAGICYWPVMKLSRDSKEILVQPEPETMLQQVEMQLWFPGRTCDAADFMRL